MKIDNALDAHIALGIAKAVSPIHTGNLRFNAIKSELVSNGFNIKYDLSEAFYIYFLEEGTRFSIKNVGFIGQRTVPLIRDFINAKYNGNGKEEHYYKILSNQGYKDRMTKKGIEKLNPWDYYQDIDLEQDIGEESIVGRGHRLAHSLAQNVDQMAQQFDWQYRSIH